MPPSFPVVGLNGIPVRRAHDVVDMAGIARLAGMEHADPDDPAVVEWAGGDKYSWSR